MSSEKVQQHSVQIQQGQVMNQPSPSAQNAQFQNHQQKNNNHFSVASNLRSQQKSQNPKIGRPAKTDQQQQFKKYYMQNKQKFELQCELLVYIHQNYFDEIIDNPINTRVNKQLMDRLFIINHCEELYRVLLKLNENYFKNSSHYPEKKLKYTSLIDVAYMCHTVKQHIGDRLSCVQLLLIIFFYLQQLIPVYQYSNEKLINENFYQYFVGNMQKFREGMIFGPGGKNSTKLDKLDKLIICLALTLADLEGILIEEEVLYSEEEDEDEEDEPEVEDNVVHNSTKRHYDHAMDSSDKPKKKFHLDHHHQNYS